MTNKILNNVAILDRFSALTEDEMLEINGSWTWTGAGISFVLGGSVGLGIYSVYQFGMDQGYKNNKK